MGLFRTVRRQAPRQSGFPCGIIVLAMVLSWSTCVGSSLYQIHRWGWT